MSTVDIIIQAGSVVLAITFAVMLWSYIKGLRHSPRELALLFAAKIMEYFAYGASNLAFVLFLSKDCGLGDISAGSYIGVWSMSITLTTMFIGAVADAIGIRTTLLIGTVILLVSRAVLPISTNIYVLTALGFLPMGIGMAMLGPVLSVGIKKYTSPATVSLGFGLFYTMMNVGWAGGAWAFDTIRGTVNEMGGHVVLGGFNMSAYQAIFLFGFVCTIVNLGFISLMRDVEYSAEHGIQPLKRKYKAEGNAIQATWSLTKQGAADTLKIIKAVFSEKAFWIFMFMLGLLIFVRFTFYHFHYTFPKYGLRVLGENIKVGSIFGVLNPVLIVFLTPLLTVVLKNVKSYTLLVVGTIISSSAIFIATIPSAKFQPLMGTWFSELMLDRWLKVPVEQQQPLLLALVIMVIVFTIGEAIWSPRLMQFTAEIAPKGKEGSYIALSALPFFLAKMFVGPLSGWLVATYTPEGATSYPLHYMVWVWIGGMALASPLGLLIFRKLFLRTEYR